MSTPTLTDDEHAKNNLPDALARWNERDGAELDRARTDQSFCVPKADIVANDYDLSINRYKEVVYDEIEYPAPAEILDELDRARGGDPEGHRRPQGDARMTCEPWRWERSSRFFLASAFKSERFGEQGDLPVGANP